jgi:phospholipid/cholesterol/gamma-HCH transport system substrate-binding protein
MRREVKIGIFLAGTFLILGTFIFIVGDMSTWFRKGGYELVAYFDSVTGLERQDAVRLAGVRIGYVKDIRLAHRQAEVQMSISGKYRVPKGSKAALASLGLIGEKYIEITPGDQAAFLEPGGALESTPAISFDQIGALALSIGEDIKGVSKSLAELTGQQNQAQIRDTLSHLNSFTQDLKSFMDENKKDLHEGIAGVSRATRELDQRIDTVSRNLDQAIAAVKDMAQENRGPVRSDIQKIGDVLDDLKESVRLLRQSLEKIDKGEGTVGKLVQDPELYDKAKATLASVEGAVEPLRAVRPIGLFRFDYLGDSRQVKTFATLGLELSPRYFVLGQAIQDPLLKKFTYSAEAGRRWDFFAARAGIIESTFGAGVDLVGLNDRLVLSVEGFDFQRDIGPHLRFTTQISLIRYLHLVAGLDDFGRSAKRQFYFGFGLGVY